jgi:hypothetical protein
VNPFDVPSPRKVWALGCLGVALAPPVLFFAGLFLGASIDNDTAWKIVLWAWALVGLGAGVPAFRAARDIGRGSNAHTPGRVLGVLGSLFGMAGALLGFFLSHMSFGHGRPLRRKGRAVTASTIETDAWCRETSFATDGAAKNDAAVARAWLGDARLEHASVAAFARLALELLALGAPPELVGRCLAAAAEELEHARDAFTLARAHGGRAIGPGEFPEAIETPRGGSPAASRTRIAVEALVDGCIGEATAAEALAEAADACSDPRLAAMLRRTAREEASHAALSWDILAWAASGHRRAVEQEVTRALDALVLAHRASMKMNPASATSAGIGRLPAAREHEIASRVVADVRERWIRERGA